MKRPPMTKVDLRWEPEITFRMPLHRIVPVARRLPEAIAAPFYLPEEEAWHAAALLP